MTNKSAFKALVAEISATTGSLSDGELKTVEEMFWEGELSTAEIAEAVADLKTAYGTFA